MIADKHNRELVIKAKAGDETAMNKLIEKNKRLVYKINHKFGNSEDGIQEGILAFYDAVRTFDESYSIKFTTHLYRWIENKIRQYREKTYYGTTRHYIKECKLRKLEYTREEFTEELIGDTASDYIKAENDSIIQPLLEVLSQKERTLINKIYFQGYTQTELAKEMGTSRQRVNYLLQIALAKLRGKLCQQSQI